MKKNPYIWVITFVESLSFSLMIFLLEVKIPAIWTCQFPPFWLGVNSFWSFTSDKCSSDTLIFLSNNLTKLFNGPPVTFSFLSAAKSYDLTELISWQILALNYFLKSVSVFLNMFRICSRKNKACLLALIVRWSFQILVNTKFEIYFYVGLN